MTLKQSRAVEVQQMEVGAEKDKGEREGELGEAHLISTIPEVRGRGRVDFPLAFLWLVMSSNCSHLSVGLFRDWKGTAGAGFDPLIMML